MPVVTAFADHPTRPYVRVEVNWADVPAVTHASVYRVDVATGACTPLRPYICYDGWELLLSCGHGIFWDTEAPLDRPFYYITTSDEAPCTPASTLIYTSFSTPLANSWGVTESGSLSPLTWVNTGGTVPGNYDVVGGSGQHTLDSVNVIRFSTVDAARPDFDIHYTTSIPVTASTAPIVARAVARFTDPNNTYFAGPQFETTGLVNLQVARIVGGVGTLISQVAGGTYLPDQVLHVRFQGVGSQLRAKIWPDGTTEPTTWAVDAVDTTLAVGTSVGLSSRANAGNTNGTFAVSYQLFEDIDGCLPCVPVSATAPTEITLASDGRFWLKDPVRPCHDRPVPLCQVGSPLLPGCDGEGGILFVGMGPEIYANNSLTLRPTNRRRTMSATRPRSDATTALRLQTLTFTDRDDLLQLVNPGSLLLFQGPTEYGIPDRYMSVQPVQVTPELPDLRIQIRTETLPYLTEDRPAGPTQGICGARVADICAGYATWDDLAATGMSWDDLVRGSASPESANPAARTWDDVNADFASWNAVNTDGRTWQRLQEGT